MNDVAKMFASASSDLADGGSGSELADVKRKVGNVRSMMDDYDKDEEARQAKKQKAAAEAEAGVSGAIDAAGEPGSEGAAGAGTSADAKEAPKAVWNQRDVKIADALKLHEKWHNEQMESVVGLIAKAKIALQAATEPSIAAMCCRDVDILKNRVHALRLVKGGAEGVTAAVELKAATGDQATPKKEGEQGGALDEPQHGEEAQAAPGTPGQDGALNSSLELYDAGRR